MAKTRQVEPKQPMRHRTMAEYALEQLREAIILGELPAGNAAAARRTGSLAGNEHLPDPRGGPAAGGTGARETRAAPGRQGARFRRRRAPRPLPGAAGARVARRAARRRAVHRRRCRDSRETSRAVRRDAQCGRCPRDDACAHRLPLHALRGLAEAVARVVDPPGLGSLGALPPGTSGFGR